ncbi:Uu.00g004710.m01.CDS01 [Anthostomella pinea]|uniref:Uu.00g004710.m01.CDS01 n=1 Tax=Anthostomella pinea TaxID=933095 RepID=A0AAI8VKY7_9PEZI|nr:Uu.00g004710.m01.CDS01 [Anthostomella pinea]
MLYFTADELIWECYEDTACECGFHCEGPYNPVSSKINHINSVLGVLPPLQFPRGDYVTFLRQSVVPRLRRRRELLTTQSETTWRRLVQFYSHLDLTNETDRLLAIGALAEQTQAVRRDQTYLAGLWSASLPGDLLWTTTNPKPGRAAGTWTAPTPTVEVLEASCEYVDGNAFGMATSGRLVLCGRAINRCSLREESGSYRPSFHLEHRDLNACMEVRMDCDEPPLATTGTAPEHWGEVTVLQVAETCEFPAPVSLILAADPTAPGSGVCVRVGLASPPGTRLEDQKERTKLGRWFGSCSEVQTFTII